MRHSDETSSRTCTEPSTLLPKLNSEAQPRGMMCEQELEGRAQVCSARFKYAVVPTFATSQRTLKICTKTCKGFVMFDKLVQCNFTF